MPALNFKKRFAELVEAGMKRQTVRAPRKDGRDPKTGDTLYLYTGMRTKACRKLGEYRCAEVTPITIGQAFIRLGGNGFLQDAACTNFARADGFTSFGEMLRWFDETHGLPFSGLLIKWSNQDGVAK